MMMPTTKNKFERGFTLLELMITMLIAMVLLGAVFTAFRSQQHTYIVQDQVVEMQQNIRAGLLMMIKEMRMAGYDPTQKANAGITVATNSRFGFTQDLNEDGDVSDSNEAIIFALKDDANGDGIVDTNGELVLGRDTGGGLQPIADNIEAIEFFYTLADGTTTLFPASTSDIRTVQISILARANNQDTKFTNTKSYTTASGSTWGPFNDNYRRRLLITTVRCRNMGI